MSLDAAVSALDQQTLGKSCLLVDDDNDVVPNHSASSHTHKRPNSMPLRHRIEAREIKFYGSNKYTCQIACMFGWHRTLPAWGEGCPTCHVMVFIGGMNKLDHHRTVDVWCVVAEHTWPTFRSFRGRTSWRWPTALGIPINRAKPPCSHFREMTFAWRQALGQTEGVGRIGEHHARQHSHIRDREVLSYVIPTNGTHECNSSQGCK